MPELEILGSGLYAGFSTALEREPGEGFSATLETWLKQSAGLPRSGSQGANAVRLGAPLLLQQVHSTGIVDASLYSGHSTAQPAGRLPQGASNQTLPLADGAVSTFARGDFLAVKTADCVPLLAADSELGRYAALHAGWRGTAAGILPKLLEEWREAGSSLKNVVLMLGPHIGGCCYEVGGDCLEQFTGADLEGAVSRNGGRSHLDLGMVLRTQGKRLGVPNARIGGSRHCTRCHTDSQGRHPYASYRRTSAEGGTLVHTNVAVIGRLPAAGDSGGYSGDNPP